NYKVLYVNVEEPLYNDGSRAGIHDSTGIIRIIKFDAVTKKPVAQFAYQIDGVAHPPEPAGAFVINGVSDILSLVKNKLLVIERSFSTGRPGCTIKIYISDLSAADHIENMSSVKNKTKMATKKLLLNMDDLGIYIDNIEGVCFGPDLPNGHKTLVFVSDNNFDSRQKTQLLLFEIE
ncbi:MAG: esterase-like activity of phytase family protein, partial [Bacteroidota bacterium]|nr:esterase-like activity of phytase family protein [Bacteroidota bacterium]